MFSAIWLAVFVTVSTILLVFILAGVVELIDLVKKLIDAKPANKSEVDFSSTSDSSVRFKDVGFNQEFLNTTLTRKSQKVEIAYDDYIKLLNELYDGEIDINGLTLDNTNQLIMRRVRQLKRSEAVRDKKKNFWR